MITIHKDPGRDFIILNLTDPQMNDAEWEEGHPHRRTLEYTLAELVERTRPDLITVSGDLAWAGEDHSYRMLMRLLDSFGIPWAPVWGNHDNQKGAEYTEFLADLALSHKNCVYEKGDPVLGNGNYIISVEEAGKPVTAVFMMDSHDREPFVNEKGEEKMAWARLNAAQIDWYSAEAEKVRAAGYRDSAMIMHIPVYAYRDASVAAYRAGLNLKEMTVAQSETEDVWNPGYEKSFGVQYEDVGSYSGEDGVFAAVKAAGHTRLILAGHDHIDNWVISYEGVTLAYGLKTGSACYWRPQLSGGTVVTVSADGIAGLRHEYVDASAFHEAK